MSEEREVREESSQSEPRPVVEEHVYEANKLKELGWSRNAVRVRPLKGWFGLAQQSQILTSKVDVTGARRVLERVQVAAESSSSAEE